MADELAFQSQHRIHPIDQPITFFGFNVMDIVGAGFLFILSAQFFTGAIPKFYGSQLIGLLCGLAVGYGVLYSGQYIRDNAPPDMIAYGIYWLISADRYIIDNDPKPMPLVPTRYLPGKDTENEEV